MRASETRRGGQHKAWERGARDSNEEPADIPELPMIPAGRLIERLSVDSLGELSRAMKLSVAELIERAN